MLGGGPVFPAWPPRRALGIVEPQASQGDLSSCPHSMSLAVSSSGQGPGPSVLGQGWQQHQQRPWASCDLLCPPQCRGDLTKTYSLEAYDNWFNCLSMLVATEVCRVRTAQQPRAG